MSRILKRYTVFVLGVILMLYTILNVYFYPVRVIGKIWFWETLKNNGLLILFIVSISLIIIGGIIIYKTKNKSV